MTSNKKNLAIKDICLIAIFSTILFVLEEAMTFLPNIQLTVFLVVLYSKLLRFKRTAIIIVVYVLLDSLFMGSINPLLVTFQLLGWLLIPILMCTLFKKVNDNIILACLSILFALLYSWILIVPGCIIFEVTFVEYLVADLLYELILVCSSFLSTILLYNPIYKALMKNSYIKYINGNN